MILRHALAMVRNSLSPPFACLFSPAFLELHISMARHVPLWAVLLRGHSRVTSFHIELQP